MTTTTTAHTPGPWTVTGPGPYDPESRVALTVEQDSPTRRQVALVGNAPATMTREEAEANARLIAAAPDLLKALQTLWDEPYEVLHQLLNDDDWDLVDAAIKKATGGDA